MARKFVDYSYVDRLIYHRERCTKMRSMLDNGKKLTRDQMQKYHYSDGFLIGCGGATVSDVHAKGIVNASVDAGVLAGNRAKRAWLKGK